MESVVPVEHGDLVIFLNRGIADSLYEIEIGDIICRFLDAGVSLNDENNLSMIAEVISTAAIEKIISFALDRPLVDKLKSGVISPDRVVVDECLCGLDYFLK
jgi:hypothetical protein